MLAAAAAATFLPGLLALTGASAVSAAQSSVAAVPAACPSGTAHTTYLGGDDFDTSTAQAADWNITEGGSFQIVSWQESGDDGRMRSANPAEAGEVEVDSISTFALPAGKTSVLALTHQHEFDTEALTLHSQGFVDIGVNGEWQQIASYDGSRTLQTEHIDLGSYAGQSVKLRFRISSDGHTSPESATGWDIDDIAFASCEPATMPAAPQSVKATGYLGKAVVTWTAPPASATAEVTKYSLEVTPGGRLVDNIPANASSWSISGLASATNYKFTVRAHSIAGAGAPRSKFLIGLKLSATPSASTITYGNSVKISGKLYRADNNTGVTGQSVKLIGRKKGTSTWSYVATTTTGSYGAYSFTKSPGSNYEYRVLFAAGSPAYLGAQSVIRPISVRTKVTGNWDDTYAGKNQTVTFAGSVAPNHKYQTIYLQVRLDGTWYDLDAAKISSTSRYRFVGTMGDAGTWYFRAYLPAHGDHAAGYTPARKITTY